MKHFKILTLQRQNTQETDIHYNLAVPSFIDVILVFSTWEQVSPLYFSSNHSRNR